MIPLTSEARIPARVPSPLSVMDFVMLTAPKPPGSRTEISPLAAVFEIAPAKALQGAVRLHGFASSPTPETQVRVAWAFAIELTPRVRKISANAFTRKRALLIMNLLRGLRVKSQSDTGWKARAKNATSEFRRQMVV